MLEQLQTLPRWLCWRIVRDGDTVSKVPFTPVANTLTACDDPSTWTDYATAAAAVAAGRYDSVGFALGKDVGLVVIDFDKVRPDINSPWPAWVLREIDELNSYTEVSASGRGIHVLCWGAIPENKNRQGLHTEMWDSNKMFAFSGQILNGRDRIERRDVSDLYARLLAGKVGPTYRQSILVERYDTKKYQEIASGDWERHGLGRSEAVRSALCTLAQKHKYDAEKMRAEFESTELCQSWEEEGKWSRLGEREIQGAIEFMRAHAPAAPTVLDFKKPIVPGGDFDFLLEPLEGSEDGWFPLGDVSLVAASSGNGKTTMMLDLLARQARKDEVFGHRTTGRPYLVLLEDRGDRALRRTLHRMKISISELPFRRLDRAGKSVADAVAAALEDADPMPQAVFIEGIDLAAEDAGKMQSVSKLLTDLHKVAEHYHCAIIGSTGCPKQKAKDRYTSLRDMVFGSSAWSRKVETIVTLQRENGKDTDDITILTILPRNSKAEEFRLRFDSGRLVEAPPEAEQPQTEEMFTHEALETWARERTELFSVKDARRNFPWVSDKTMSRHLEDLEIRGALSMTQKGRLKLYAAIPFEVPE